MSKASTINHEPRRAITTILPACALAGFQSEPTQNTTHRFDSEFERTLTNRQFLEMRYRNVITLAKALEKHLGREKAITFLKEAKTNEMLERGKESRRMRTTGARAFS